MFVVVAGKLSFVGLASSNILAVVFERGVVVVGYDTGGTPSSHLHLA